MKRTLTAAVVTMFERPLRAERRPLDDSGPALVRSYVATLQAAAHQHTTCQWTIELVARVYALPAFAALAPPHSEPGLVRSG